MHIVSVICILLLLFYLLISLALTPKQQGRHLFRMVYSALALGILSGVYYAVFEGIVSDFSPYINPSQNILRAAYGYFMLLIPVAILGVTAGLCLKKKRPVFTLSLVGGISLAAAGAILVYSFIADQGTSNAFAILLEFSVLYLPCLFYFLVSGILDTDKKWERIMHVLSMYLYLAAMTGYLIYMGVSQYSLFAELGIAALLPLIPIILLWILIPVVPIGVYHYLRNKDAIRTGETLPGKLRVRFPRKNSKGKE